MTWKVFENVIGTIGNTPLVKLNRITKDCNVTVVAKLEARNPGIKSLNASVMPRSVNVLQWIV